jgi:peptidoglycan-N-acetylglucosamine deacetylase
MARVTLTFDNGPEAAITNHCLDVLAKHGLKTTFFAIGKKLHDPANREALARAKAEGHWIGNHSYTHSRSLGSESQSLFDVEVEQAQELLGDLAHPDKLFRPFFNAGVLDNRLFKKSDIGRLEAGKYTVVMYDTLCGDWGDGEVWVNRALASISRKPWCTLILHDIVGYPDGYRTNSMRRLDEFFIRAKEAGHEIIQEFDPAMVYVDRGATRVALEPFAN